MNVLISIVGNKGGLKKTKESVDIKSQMVVLYIKNGYKSQK